MQNLLQHSFNSDTAQLEQVRQRIRETLQDYSCDHEFTETCVLAVDEAVTNVMRHGYGLGNPGKLTVTIGVDDGVDGKDVVFGIRDFARSFDPGAKDMQSTGELRSGGYGRLLMREIMDSVGYAKIAEDKGNLLEMRRRLQLTMQDK